MVHLGSESPWPGVFWRRFSLCPLCLCGVILRHQAGCACSAPLFPSAVSAKRPRYYRSVSSRPATILPVHQGAAACPPVARFPNRRRTVGRTYLGVLLASRTPLLWLARRRRARQPEAGCGIRVGPRSIHIAPSRDDFVVAGVADPGERPTEKRTGLPGLNKPGCNLPRLVAALSRGGMLSVRIVHFCDDFQIAEFLTAAIRQAQALSGAERDCADHADRGWRISNYPRHPASGGQAALSILPRDNTKGLT